MTPRQVASDAFREHGRRIIAAAYAIVRDEEEARDVASECFLALLLKGPVEPELVLPWLLRTARNKALNRLRDKQRSERRPRPQMFDEVPHERIVVEGTSGLLAAATMELSDRDRAAIELRHVRGLDLDVVAAALGIKPKAAAVVVHRALNRLRVHTLKLLASHHDVASACSNGLIAELKAGREVRHCVRCDVISEEFLALTSRAATPWLPAIFERLLSRTRQIASGIGRRACFSSNAAEAFAVMILAVGLTMPASAQARPIFHLETNSTAAPHLSTHAFSSARNGLASQARRVTRLKALVVRQDGKEDLGVPGLPVPVPVKALVNLSDAVDRAFAQSTDIRSMGIATTLDKAGKADGILLMVTLDSPPVANRAYDFQWYVRYKSEFGWKVHFATDSRGRPMIPTVWFGDPRRELTDPGWTHAVFGATSGSMIAIIVPFSILPREVRNVMKPDSVLEYFRVETFVPVGGQQARSTDYEDGPIYKIEK